MNNKIVSVAYLVSWCTSVCCLYVVADVLSSCLFLSGAVGNVSGPADCTRTHTDNIQTIYRQYTDNIETTYRQHTSFNLLANSSSHYHFKQFYKNIYKIEFTNVLVALTLLIFHNLLDKYCPAPSPAWPKWTHLSQICEARRDWSERFI